MDKKFLLSKGRFQFLLSLNDVQFSIETLQLPISDEKAFKVLAKSLYLQAERRLIKSNAPDRQGELMEFFHNKGYTVGPFKEN
jgi:hypothetical protein